MKDELAPRRQTLNDVMDAMMMSTMKNVIAGGIWKSSDKTAATEEKVNRTRNLVIMGGAKLKDFRVALAEWMASGIVLDQMDLEV